MEVGVLGSTVVVGPDARVDALARKPRAVLAALALDPGRILTADRLVDLVWCGSPPAGAHGTLQAYLSNLRRVFEPGLRQRSPSAVIATADDGYRLLLPSGRVDAVAFAADVRLHHAALDPLWSQLTTGWSSAWPPAAAVVGYVDALERALGRWRGLAFADLGYHPDVLVERAALDELRTTAQEDLQLALLALGEHAAVVVASEQLVARAPVRERTRCLQALALLRSGRQVDALDALRDYRRQLDDELGLEPGPELQALLQAVLRQEPALWSTLARVQSDEPGPDEGRHPTAGPAHLPPRTASSALTSVDRQWRTVGREREITAVRARLEGVVAGHPHVLVVVGEPGIGKTRLVQDAAGAARELGFAVAVARCSQDDGAPPLWPWYRILAALGVDHPTELARRDAEDDDGPVRAFAVQQALVQAVRQAVRSPVLVVVEDLHWADTRTSGALAHLVTGLEPGDRIAVLLTRRAHPVPTGALLDLGAALAREGAEVIELAGLRSAEAERLVAEITGDTAPAAVGSWCAQTDGNPFFLVELARLGRAGGGWHDVVPDSVKTVVAERLADLPDDTREALVMSAALGREHSPLLLARAGGWSPEEVLKLLEPAQRIGIVHVRGDGRVAFEHALTREAVVAGALTGQLSRAHARIARTLELAPPVDLSATECIFELAQHWSAAGPAHAAVAWRAAVTAAVEARRAWASVEATALYTSALASHALDPAATREERYELLLGFAEVGARAARWRAVVDAVVEAVELARADEDPERVAVAVAGLTRYNIWLPQSYGEVVEDLVDDLRAALSTAGPHDSPTRCRLMLALAVQLYYVPGYEPEIEALTDEGLGMARRLGDAELRGWAARTAGLALWRPRYLDRRLALAREEVVAARECADEAAEAVGRAALAGAAVEAADFTTWTVESAAAEATARRRRLPYVEFALGLVRLSLALMAGRLDEAEQLDSRLRAMRREVTTPADDSLDFAIAFASGTWRPEQTHATAEAFRLVMETHPDPFLRVGSVFQLARAGRHEEVRAALARKLFPPVPDQWHATMEAAERADIAGRVEAPVLAGQAVDVLSRARGRMVVAGVSIGFGPVDGYLALAFAVLGRTDEARGAAADAEALATSWGLTTYLDWLAERRSALGF